MVGYLAIFAASLGGLGGFPAWIIAASALCLVLVSYAQNETLYQRANAAGRSGLVNLAILRISAEAGLACGAAYVCGWLISTP